jgi:hypothetical protein
MHYTVSKFPTFTSAFICSSYNSPFFSRINFPFLFNSPLGCIQLWHFAYSLVFATVAIVRTRVNRWESVIRVGEFFSKPIVTVRNSSHCIFDCLGM